MCRIELVESALVLISVIYREEILIFELRGVGNVVYTDEGGNSGHPTSFLLPKAPNS